MAKNKKSDPVIDKIFRKTGDPFTDMMTEFFDPRTGRNTDQALSVLRQQFEAADFFGKKK